MAASEQPAGVEFARHAPRVELAGPVTLEIPLGLLLEPLDPMRHDMDDEAMLELQDSIRQHGLFENLCVVPVMPADGDKWARVEVWDIANHIARGGRYRVAAGHRRLLACRAVRHDPVRCSVFHNLAVEEDAIMSGENMIREEPSDYDLAVLYSKWLQDETMTEARLKRLAGKTLEFIYGRAKILQGYENVARALHARQITFSVARELNHCKEADFAQHFLNMAIDQGAKPKLVRAWVQERAALVAQSVPAAPAGPVKVGISAPAFVKVECLLCGDSQSYNLQTVMMCGADVERIRAARAQAESAENAETNPSA